MNQTHGAFDFNHAKSSVTEKSKPKSPRSPGKIKNNNKRRQESLVTYLNVHAGVSVGVMAGMDVGAKDRFEVAKT